MGYDIANNAIKDPPGGFSLVDDRGKEAATWHFALIEHWNKKHAKAATSPRRFPRLLHTSIFTATLSHWPKKQTFFDF
jgi:hypothetical protein